MLRRCEYQREEFYGPQQGLVIESLPLHVHLSQSAHNVHASDGESGSLVAPRRRCADTCCWNSTPRAGASLKRAPNFLTGFGVVGVRRYRPLGHSGSLNEQQQLAPVSDEMFLRLGPAGGQVGHTSGTQR